MLGATLFAVLVLYLFVLPPLVLLIAILQAIFFRE